MPELLNPEIQIALQAAVAFLADTVTTGEGEISVPLSGAYLNGFVFSCGRARLIQPSGPAGPWPEKNLAPPRSRPPGTLEISLLGAHRDAGWHHSWNGTAVLLPEDQSAGSPDLLRRLNSGLQELLAETVSTGFAQRWNPDWLERLAGLEQEIGMTRGFLEVADEPDTSADGHTTEALPPGPDDAQLDGHLFRRVAGHWVWVGRAS